MLVTNPKIPIIKEIGFLVDNPMSINIGPKTSYDNKFMYSCDISDISNMTGAKFFNKDMLKIILPKRNSLYEKIINNSILFDFVNNKKSKNFIILQEYMVKFETEFELFSNMNNKPILYLEFGVWEGKSIAVASKNKDPNSLFYGFDTFTGLPEDFTKGMIKGYFSTNEVVPKIDDNRIKFVKGLFSVTLDEVLPEIISNLKDRQLFINMDADLFSSTLFVLTKLNSIITEGVYIRFDEFGELSENSEFLAFRDYVRAFGKDFEIIMADKWYRHITIKIKPNPDVCI